MLTSLGNSKCCDLATVHLLKALQPCNTTVATLRRKRCISATPSSVIVGVKGLVALLPSPLPLAREGTKA
jgi:hypothetical protein